MKQNVTISVELMVLEEFKKTGLNRSHICEDALRACFRSKITDKPEERECAICGAKDEPGAISYMVWDGFLERWVCYKCNKNEIRQVSIMAGK